MFLTRFVHPSTDREAVGVLDADDTLRPLDVPDLHDLLSLGIDDIKAAVESPGPVVSGSVTWLPPVSGLTEVWASGVTYERSRVARIEESSVGNVYELVYDADRPELFFKSPAWRVVTDGEVVGLRSDSELDVPEPEVAVLANRDGLPVGYTVCNDVSSRSIEGANPLYLPQAKIYAGACALHHRIRLAWTVAEPQALEVHCAVAREGAVVWQDRTNTARMRRTFDELLSWAFRADRFPHGMMLSTGTGIVPDLSFSLEQGDTVTIEVEGLGTLVNPVVRGLDNVPERPLLRQYV